MVAKKIAAYSVRLSKLIYEYPIGPFDIAVDDVGLKVRAVGVHGYEIEKLASENRAKQLQAMVKEMRYTVDKIGPCLEISYKEIEGL